MKLIFDCGVFLDHRFGGVLRYIQEIASGLHERFAASAGTPDADRVAVMAGFHCSPLTKADLPAGVFSGRRVPHVRGAARVCRVINDQFLRATLRKLGHETVILHETLFGCTVPRLPGVRRVVTVHDLIWEESPGMAPPLALQAKARSIAHADAVVYVSQATQKAFRRHYPEPAMSAVIHHGSELRLARDRRPAGIPWPYVLYVGQRGGYKNWDRFIQAISRSRIAGTHGVVMFGVTPSARETEFVASTRWGRDRVRWIHGDDDLLADLFEGASCFVYPSLAEGFGMPLLEAARLGCPIACSDIPPFREVLGDGGVFFDPLSPACIASAVETAVNAGRQSAAARQAFHSSATFRWSDTCAKTADFYMAVVGCGTLLAGPPRSEICGSSRIP